MNNFDLRSLLPDPSQNNFGKIKAEHPYNILLKYAKVLEEKYPYELSGVVTESTDLTNSQLLSYGFYILAAIGNGYSYKLFDLEPTTAEMYPLNIIVFENTPQHLTEVKNPIELENALNGILRSGFTHTLILNLLAQIEIYKESRKG